MNPFRLHLPSVHLLTVRAPVCIPLLSALFQITPRLCTNMRKMLDGNYDLPGGEWQRGGLVRREWIFFSYGGAPCWLSLLVFPAVRVGKQTAPAAFITSMVPGAFWKWHKEGRQLYNLQLLPNEMSVGGIRTNSRV